MGCLSFSCQREETELFWVRQAIGEHSPVVSQPQTRLRFAPDIAMVPVEGEYLVISRITAAWCYLSERELQVAISFCGQSIADVASAMALPVPLLALFAAQLQNRGILLDGDPSFQPKGLGQMLTRAATARFTLTLLLANQCNLACDYCYHAFAAYRPVHHLQRHHADLALRYAFGQPADQIMIDFGEIAVSEDLAFALLERGRQLAAETGRPAQFAIQTNGTTLTERLTASLKQNGVFVGLSLDGPEELHDAMRHSAWGRGSYAQARAGLGHLLQAGVPHIVSATIHRLNAPHVAAILDHLEGLGVTYFVLKPVLRRGSAAVAWNEIGISSDEYSQVLDTIACRSIELHNLDALDATFVMMLQRALGDRRGWSTLCHSGYCAWTDRQLVVNAEGFCYPCPRYSSPGEAEFCQGHIEDFASRRHSASRAPLDGPSPSQCHTCPWTALCNGGCPLASASGWGDDLCAINASTYDLVFLRLLPALRSRDFVRACKLGDLDVVHERFFDA